MNQIFLRLIPYDVSQFTKKRLGKDGDGGYVLAMDPLKEIEAVVVFGINDEDSFETHLAKHVDPKKVPFYLCDPFVPYTAEGKNDFHFSSLGLAGETKEKMITLPDFLKAKNLEGKKILLKVDIEGAEWESFANLQPSDFDNVVCLIIEFHRLIHLQEVPQQVKTLDLLNSRFVLNHCHVNNNGYVNRFGPTFFPDVLECSYINKKFLEENNISFERRRQIYPCEIDQQNIDVHPDYPIGWWLHSDLNQQR
jgi:hypothetical protein